MRRLFSNLACSSVFLPPRCGIATSFTPRRRTCLAARGLVKATIPGEYVRRLPEARDVPIYGRDELIAVDRIAVEDPIVGDQADAALDQQHLVAEFHGLVDLAALDHVA